MWPTNSDALSSACGPRPAGTVYRRVVTRAGEPAWVDRGSFDKVRIGHGTRAIFGFVMILGQAARPLGLSDSDPRDVYTL